MSIISGIYKIANKVTREVYIGSSVNICNRFRYHKSKLIKNCHDNDHLQKVFNKYGLESFSFEIVKTVNDKTELIKLEQHYIDTLSPKYNICKIAGSCLGVKHSKEHNLKISRNNARYWKNKKRSKETKNKISTANEKSFEFISPNGTKVEGKNLLKFCKKHKLHVGHMCAILHNKRKSHKGWLAVLNKTFNVELYNV